MRASYPPVSPIECRARLQRMLPLPTRPRSIIDRLVDHGRILAADLPPSFVSKFAATVSKIAAAYPSSTFGAAATSVIDHISSVPTLSELGRHAMNGQLSAVVRAEVRRLSYMASRRHLQNDDAFVLPVRTAWPRALGAPAPAL